MDPARRTPFASTRHARADEKMSSTCRAILEVSSKKLMEMSNKNMSTENQGIEAALRETLFPNRVWRTVLSFEGDPLPSIVEEDIILSALKNRGVRVYGFTYRGDTGQSEVTLYTGRPLTMEDEEAFWLELPANRLSATITEES